MLGSDLLESLDSLAATQIFAPGSRELDITDDKVVEEGVRQTSPEIIVNCAAFTDVDGCEKEKEKAEEVNARGPGHLAKAAKTAQALLIHISTDYIFDGKKDAPYTEEDPPHPLNVYGKTKLEGEGLVRQAGGDWLILRTSWLYGATRKNFVKTILELSQKHAEISVVTDQRGSPTYTRDLAEAIRGLIQRSCRSQVASRTIFHIANKGLASRYELAEEIIRLAGNPTQVRPILSSQWPRAAKVPEDSSLDISKFEQETHLTMRPWQAALADFLATFTPKKVRH
jgi:dTDP-4-dehydrorhamnose reductase